MYCFFSVGRCHLVKGFSVQFCLTKCGIYWSLVLLLALSMVTPILSVDAKVKNTGKTVLTKSSSELKEKSKNPSGMVLIPSGNFWMGSEQPGFIVARPIHEVQLD